MRFIAAFVLACSLFATAPATAAPAATWNGDLAAARAFMTDAARIHELRRRGKVEVRAIGTMSALEAVAQGKVALVATARPADPRTPLEQGLVYTPIAWDALAAITHPGNPVKALTLAQLRDVFAGRIRDWSELGGPAKAINVYAVAGPQDGVEWSYRRLLYGDGNARIAARRWYINTKQLEDAVAIDPAAIAFSVLSNTQAHKGIRALAIDGVTPSLATIEAGRYPLITPLYLVARPDAPGVAGSLPQARNAVEFFHTEAALKTEMRRKQLVPALEAPALAAGQAAREAALSAALGYTFVGAPDPGPPQPPAPAKNRIVNHVAATAAAPLDATRPAPVPAAASARERNRVETNGRTRTRACRPVSVCN